MAIRIGINGFGRIGRLVYRACAGTDVEIVAVNDLVPADSLGYLLKYDTVHGRFGREVRTTENTITCEGKTTKTFSERDPANIPWGDSGVDYVLEATGFFTAYADASKHLTAGAKRVLISAPTKTPDEVPTFAFKVNSELYNPDTDTVISNASCTTNCLAPIAKVIVDEHWSEKGAETGVWLATSNDVADVSGGYWFDRRRKKGTRDARNEEAPARLWAETERIVGSVLGDDWAS